MNAADDLETQLRAMLRSRAEDIQNLPPGVLPTPVAGESQPPRRPAGLSLPRRAASHPRRSLLIAAAVAAVLAVSAGVATVAVDRGSSGRRPPAGTVPTPTAPRATSSPAVSTPAAWSTCSTTLPPAWNAKLEDPGSAGVPSDTPLATSPDGSILYYRDLGTSREVRLRRPDGSSTRLLEYADSQKLAPQFGAFSGKYAVVGLIYAPRGGNGTGDALFALDVIDVSTDQLLFHRPLMTMSDYESGGLTTEGMGVANGRIYWDERPTYPSATGRVRWLAIVGGKSGVAYTGPAVTVHGSAGGVYWADRAHPDASGIAIAAQGLPAAVLAATTPISRMTLATDGTRYVWLDSRRRSIGHYDGRRVGYRSVGTVATRFEPNQAPLAVVGQYVTYYDPATSRSVLLDVRTGARAPLPDPVFLTGGGGSDLTGSYSDGTSASQLLQVDTSTLPDLQC